jgi:hypothetical protein
MPTIRYLYNDTSASVGLACDLLKERRWEKGKSRQWPAQERVVRPFDAISDAIARGG